MDQEKKLNTSNEMINLVLMNRDLNLQVALLKEQIYILSQYLDVLAVYSESLVSAIKSLSSDPAALDVIIQDSFTKQMNNRVNPLMPKLREALLKKQELFDELLKYSKYSVIANS